MTRFETLIFDLTNPVSRGLESSQTKKLPVNVIVNVNVKGQPPATAEFRLAFYIYVYYKRLRTTFLVQELSYESIYLDFAKS